MGNNNKLDKEPQDRIVTIKVPNRGLSVIDKLTAEQLSAILREYNKNYWHNGHNHGIFERNLDNFLTLPQEEMEKLAYIYLKSCSDFAFRLYCGLANSGSFPIWYEYVIDENNTISDVFDKGYINMLKSLLNKLWRDKYDKKGEENKISINGVDIDDINNEKFNELVVSKMPTKKIGFRKDFLNNFITLFLSNSLGDRANGRGHLVFTEKKNVSIEIGENYIRITDNMIKDFYDKQQKLEIAEDFPKSHILDGPLNFENKTIRTFYEMIKMLNEHGYNYKFDCGFNNDLNFFIELKF